MGKDEKLPSVKQLAREERPCLAICAGKHCARAGTKKLRSAASDALLDAGRQDSIAVTLTKCQDYCDDGPVVTLLPARYSYLKLSPKSLRQMVVDYVCGGLPLLSLKGKRLKV